MWKKLRETIRKFDMKYDLYKYKSYVLTCGRPLSNELFDATIFGYSVDKIKFLVESCGVNVTVCNNYPIFIASNLGHPHLVKYFIEAGADVTVNNNASIRVASIKGYSVEVVKLLIEAGADPRANNNEPICWASFYGHTDVVKLLIEAGANATANDNEPIRLALYTGYTEVVKLLIESGARADSTISCEEELNNLLKAHGHYNNIFDLFPI